MPPDAQSGEFCKVILCRADLSSRYTAHTHTMCKEESLTALVVDSNGSLSPMSRRRDVGMTYLTERWPQTLLALATHFPLTRLAISLSRLTSQFIVACVEFIFYPRLARAESIRGSARKKH